MRCLRSISRLRPMTGLALASSLFVACTNSGTANNGTGGSGSGLSGTGGERGSSGLASGSGGSGGVLGSTGRGSSGSGGSASGAQGTGGEAAGSGNGGAGNQATGGAGGAAGSGGQAGDRFAMTFKPVPITGATNVTDAAASGGSSVGLAGTGKALRSQACRPPASWRFTMRRCRSARSASRSTARRRQGERSLLGRAHRFVPLRHHQHRDSRQRDRDHQPGSGDVAVNIDRVIVGTGDLGLPPDIWNLPPFQPAVGPLHGRLEGAGPGLLGARVVA